MDVLGRTNLCIKWSPEAVSTMSLVCPGSSLKAASSNSFCMSPRPKKPLHIVSQKARPSLQRRYTQVAPLPRTRTITLDHCQVAQASLAARNPLLMGLERVPGLFLASSDALLPPTRGSTAVSVFDEEVCSTYLFPCVATAPDPVQRFRKGRRVRSHKRCEFRRVCATWRLPARVFSLGMEVVWQVLGV